MDTTNKTLEFHTKENYTSDSFMLKYNNNVLESDASNPYTFKIVGIGTEYIRTYYYNSKGERKYYDFEIIIGEFYITSISQFNEMGQQVKYKTY